MKILIVSQYFWPENFRINEICEYLSAKNIEIDVLTGAPNYPEGKLFDDFKKNKFKYNKFCKANIIRVPILLRENSSQINLFLNYISFVFSAIFFGSLKLRDKKYDLIFTFGTSPITSALPAVYFSKIKNTKHILWVLDIWPDVIKDIQSIRGRYTFLYHILTQIVKWIEKTYGIKEFENCLNCGLGSCNTMGTASSVALMVETLGFAIPGTSTIPSGAPERVEAARNSGREIVKMVNEDLTPAKILSPASFRNAIRVLHSVGGSTNAILHLLALSGRVGGELTPEQINLLGENIPVLADVEPSGEYLIQDFHNAGGLPQLLTALGDHIEGDALNQSGKSWKSQLTKEFIASPAIRALNNPLKEGGAFTLVKGNLAPDGALLKTSAASPHLLVQKGAAVVFNGYEEMRIKLDDPDLDIAPDSILVLRGCGAVGVPGAPEWGMMQIPKKLALQGITDMVRITDARMSGTSFGACLLHVSPEAAVGGPLALVENGDLISLDVPAGRLDLLISPEELEKRRANWIPPKSEHLRGWPALYQKHVLQPDLGCDFDFLRAPTPELRRFVPPIVGRS